MVEFSRQWIKRHSTILHGTLICCLVHRRVHAFHGERRLRKCWKEKLCHHDLSQRTNGGDALQGIPRGLHNEPPLHCINTCHFNDTSGFIILCQTTQSSVMSNTTRTNSHLHVHLGNDMYSNQVRKTCTGHGCAR